jgi:bifunctional DNA-binding transcriptional regulator/antitoxin component of YhaV-PrlF toxin-antitoxin module
MKLTISYKGWVVIPAKYRNKYNLEPGGAGQVIFIAGAC